MLIPQESSTFSNTQIFNTQGHRGCRGLMPENTIEAMLKALDLGVVTLEMDVCISKDQQVFLSHEPFFNHKITTCPDGTFLEEENEHIYNLYNMLYADIKRYDAGLKQHPDFLQQQQLKTYKPLLQELFRKVKHYITLNDRPFPFFNIEIKSLPETDNFYHPEPTIFINLVMNIILAENMEKQVNIQSFDVRILQNLRQNYPTIPIAMLIEGNDTRSLDDHLKALGFLPDIYSPEQSLITKELINECHRQNIKVIPWTVNSLIAIKAFKAMGADGIISDYPDLFNCLD